jgi:hypothetical protein
MIKTKAHIQALIVNGDRPKNFGKPVVVRAPLFMKCFRATIIVNNYGQLVGNDLFISTSPTNLEENCLYLSGTMTTATQTPPDNDFTTSAPMQLILDRRGVGYMEDEFYLYSSNAYVTIIWEGTVE